MVTSNGFTYNCETGILSWDSTVTVNDPNDEAVLYDAATKPQTLVAGPVHLPHGPGPASLFLGTFKCGSFQFDIHTPGRTFIAGHKGTNGPCTVPSTTTTTTAPPAVTTTTAPPTVTTTTTAPPATHTRTRTAAPAATTPPATSTSTSSVMATTYSVAPVAAGVNEAGTGSGLTLGQWLLALLGLVALWVALGRPSPRIQRSPGRHELR